MSRLHKPKAGFWIRLCVAIIYPLCSVLFRIRWHHLDRMPARGGVIVVINHVSYIDTLLMARLIWQTGRIPRFMIKSGVFEQAGARHDHARLEADPGRARHGRRGQVARRRGRRARRRARR